MHPHLMDDLARSIQTDRHRAAATARLRPARRRLRLTWRRPARPGVSAREPVASGPRA